MTPLAPTMQSFFTVRLSAQRNAGQHRGRLPRRIPAPARFRAGSRKVCRRPNLCSKTWTHLQSGSSWTTSNRAAVPRIKTRNSRLAAIHSLYRFAAMQHPEHASLIQRVLAIPAKRAPRALISYLTIEEIDTLLAAPDVTTRIGRRDRALLAVAVYTGLRACELVGLRRSNVSFGTGAHVDCIGKGRKRRTHRSLSRRRRVLGSWIDEAGGQPERSAVPWTPRWCPFVRDGLSRGIVQQTRRPPPPRHVRRWQARRSALASFVTAARCSSERRNRRGHDRTVARSRVHPDDGHLPARGHGAERAGLRPGHTCSTPRGRYRPSDPLLSFLEAL